MRIKGIFPKPVFTGGLRLVSSFLTAGLLGGSPAFLFKTREIYELS